jgi:hypothetical protein
MVSSGFERLAVRCAVITRHLARPQRSPLVRMEMDIRRAPLRLSSRKGDRSNLGYREQSQETASEYRLHGRLN